MSYFFPSHLLCRVGKLQQMVKKKCQTVGDAALLNNTILFICNYYLYKIIMQYSDDYVLLIKLPVLTSKGQEKLSFGTWESHTSKKSIKFGTIWSKLSKS